jgi:Penicillin-insensitive murein endopeptidase
MKKGIDVDGTINYSVQLYAAVPVDSGGHSHDGNRPMGRYIVPKESGTGVDTIASGTRHTDSTGVLKFKFFASQFGGVERIRAQLVDDTTKWDTLSLKTRVPGLMLLPEGTKYNKVGGTCKHHGPRDDSQYQNCREPDNNHYGTNRLVQAIQAIAVVYDSLNPGVRLRVNDMSLRYGGLFDVDTTEWKSPHKSHRIGINVDYHLQCRDSLNHSVALNEKHFKKIVWDKTKVKPFRHKPPDPPHYHVYVKED